MSKRAPGSMRARQSLCDLIEGRLSALGNHVPFRVRIATLELHHLFDKTLHLCLIQRFARHRVLPAVSVDGPGSDERTRIVPSTPAA